MCYLVSVAFSPNLPLLCRYFQLEDDSRNVDSGPYVQIKSAHMALRIWSISWKEAATVWWSRGANLTDKKSTEALWNLSEGQCLESCCLILISFFFRHQFVENNLILKMGPVDKRKVSQVPDVLHPVISYCFRSDQFFILGSCHGYGTLAWSLEIISRFYSWEHSGSQGSNVGVWKTSLML